MKRSESRAVRDRVVLLHSSDELYGSDRMVLQVIDSMPIELRMTLMVLLPRLDDGPGELTAAIRSSGVEVSHRDLPILRRRGLTRPLAVLALLRRTVALSLWLRGQRVGFIYCATSATTPSLVAARAAGVPRTLVHVQEVWGPVERALLGPLVGMADQIVTISNAVHDALPDRLRRRAVVVENGIATPTREVVVRSADEPMRFLVASRWNAWKGHGTLLDAWETFEEPPGELLIAGAAPELGERVDVPALVAALSHPDSVHVVGQVDSVFDLLDDVDALVVPSDNPEPFGLVAIEAFSRGRAVIASDAGGLADIVEHETNGLTFTPRSVDGLAAMLSADRPTLVRLGAAGHAKFEKRYSAAAFKGRMAAVWLKEYRP